MSYLYKLLLLLSLLPAVAWPAEQFTVRVIDKKPQPRNNFVQGLEIPDQYLYVGTGGYGSSRLLRYHFEDGSLDKSTRLSRDLFGEGVTVLGDTVYQLTWRNGVMLTYDREQLQPRRTFPLTGEGWGLTNDGSSLIVSNGGKELLYLSPATGKVQRSIIVTEDGRPLTNLNELEWIDGSIWANIWQTDRIVIIDPDSGKVTGNIDLRGLLPATEYRPGTDVLNGIARNPADDSIWVTGKHWPWLYRIELVPAATQETQQSTLFSR